MTSYRLSDGDGRPLVSEDCSTSWANRGVHSSMNGSIINSPSDSINDTFVTAIEDDANETQYMSVLETTRDMALEDMHDINVGNSKIIVPGLDSPSESGDSNLNENGEQQVVLFKLEGSDDLYGIQLTQDEEGTVQNYQFQLRTREDGQLEAIPDTIQLLPNNSDCNQKCSEDASGIDSHDSQIDIQNEQVLQTPVFISEETDIETVHTLALPEEEDDVFIEKNIESTEGSQMDNHNEGMNENTLLVLIKNELSFQGVETIDEDAIEHPEESLETENNSSEDENIDVKPGIVELQETHQDASPDNIKQEYHGDHRKSLQNEGVYNEETAEIPCSETEVHEETVIDGSVECHSEADTYDTDVQDETLIEYQHFDSQNVDEVCEETDDPNNLLDQQQISHEEHFSNIFIANGQIEELDCNGEFQQHIIQEDIHYLQEDLRDNDSDNEDYEIVEGLPVTAEGDISEASSSPIYEQESLYNEAIIQQLPLRKHNSSMTTNILKHSLDSNNTKDSKKKTLLYYMVHTDQKENVDSYPLGDETVLPVKPNPRSVLKNNVEVKSQDNNELILEKVREREKVLEKRYARSKEAVQAKLFNNFINKTTIPHAPIRQIRLPRKQEIKPVDTRRDEEIIVKEVMVSEKGFVENMKERLKSKDKFEVTSIVELSDSDEEYNPNSNLKKKKKHKKPAQISTVTSEDSDTSVIEIIQSDEEADKQSKSGVSKKPPIKPKKNLGDALKRPRGRPPKQDGSSPQKKSRTESSEVESDTGKKDYKCSRCSKTFPSQSSLSTHLHHHNLENSLRQSSKFSTMGYKYKCDQCEEKFKNTILLERHICKKKDAKLKCNACSKVFKDITLLNMHIKTHVKQNLMKNTSTVTISPKKFLPKPSIGKLKSPKKTIPIYKCQCCSKICPTQVSLTIHERSHKNFVCINCKATFSSKILLDSHVRLSCVKPVSPKSTRLSFKIKKSFVQSPRRASMKRKSVNPGLNSVSMSRPLDVEVTCDSCSMKFNTLTALFKHKVKEHGLQTPDKKVLVAEKKTLHKPLTVHGGIPASARLNKVFQGLREKMTTLKANSTILETSDKK